MIRIESRFESLQRIPYPTPRGAKPKFFDIKPMVGGEPGVTELSELDSLTIERMRYWYERRPIDAKDKGKEDAPHIEIGLLKITIVDGAPTSPTPPRDDRQAERPASHLEPPRRDTRAAAPTPAPARKERSAKPPKPRKAAA
jgi:hypothetical protein